MSATDGSWEAPELFKVPDQIRYDRSGNNRVVDKRGLFVLHAVLLHTGKVLVFCGHVENADYGGDGGKPTGLATSDYRGVSYLFDPNNPSATMTPIYFPTGVDLFCCHYVHLPDGRILVVGGSVDFHVHGSMGAKNICFFDPLIERWELSKTGSSTNFLDQGRWYPTAVLLGDGKVVVFSGRDEPGTSSPFIADKVEILAPPNYSAQEVSGALFQLPIYPGMHLAPSGKIFFSGTNWGQEIPNPNTRALTVNSSANTGAWDTLGGALKPNQENREEGMSILLPPAEDGKILLFGGTLALDSSNRAIMQNGGPPVFDDISSVNETKSAEVLDTLASPPTWTPTSAALNHGRVNGHGVLLPDGTVLILGGHNHYKWFDRANGTTPSLICEIFDGSTFRQVASLTHPRMYHSIALLLPDGRVMVAGGADRNEEEPALHQNPGGAPKRFVPPYLLKDRMGNLIRDAMGRTVEAPYPEDWNAPVYGGFSPGSGAYFSIAYNRKDYEIYKPPYFFKGVRPKIDSVSMGSEQLVSTTLIYYGEEFVIDTANANSITTVVLMKPGAPTHHTDSEQRYVNLTFTNGTSSSSSSTFLFVDSPSDRNIAPPGYYMLWIIENDLPCDKAVFIQLA